MEHNEPARRQLTEGLRNQKAGELVQALDCYRAAEQEASSADVRSEALRRQSSVYRMLSEWDLALDRAREAADIARAAKLPEQLGDALNAEAGVYIARGQYPQAISFLDAILRTTDDARIRGVALQNLGAIAAQSGDFETARRHFLASHECFQEAGYVWGQALVLNNFARAALDHGNYMVAASMIENAVGAARRVQDQDLLALATLNQAEAIAGLRDYARADELAHSAFRYFTSAGNLWRMVECLRLLGDIADRQGNAAEAESLYRQGLALAREISAAVEVKQLEERLSGRERPTRPGEPV